MDRGAWWASVHGVARVRYDLVAKPSKQVSHSAVAFCLFIFSPFPHHKRIPSLNPFPTKYLLS